MGIMQEHWRYFIQIVNFVRLRVDIFKIARAKPRDVYLVGIDKRSSTLCDSVQLVFSKL